MALQGTIGDFGLPDIFQLIGLQRKTGLLTLKHEQDQVMVFFENGMVVNADSSAKRLEDRLGNVLVKQNKLSKESLEEALATQKQTLQRLGHVLLTQNYITQKDLKDAINVQVAQIVFKVFRWRDGEYHFAPSETVDYDRENFNPLSADFILMEGIRMVDEWPIIEKKIPSMDIVFKPAVDPHSYEANPQDRLALSHADVVIENGGGYDDFVDTMLKAGHGSKAVFLGRWVALVRIAAAWLAGINHMKFTHFFFWNALGGITWAITFGLVGLRPAMPPVYEAVAS